MKKKIAIVASFKNEAECLEKFIDTINGEASKYNNIYCKIIFVNDFSDDGSEEIIKQKMYSNRNIILANTKKNYGGSHSIHFGFSLVPEGYYATVIDCDLQDPANLIFETLQQADNETLYHFQRKERDEGLFQNFYTKIAYYLLSVISFNKLVKNSNYFKIIPPYVVSEIKKSSEIYPYWNYFITKFATKNKIIKYIRVKRFLGTPKFGLLTTNPWATFYGALNYFFLNSIFFFLLCIGLTHFVFKDILIFLVPLMVVQVVNLLSFISFSLIKKLKKRVKIEAEIIN